jgi:HK97 family phage major capsid protein
MSEARLIPIHALRQKKFDLRATAGKMLAKIAAEGRDLNSTELAAHERNVAALAENEAEIIKAEAELATERAMPATAHIDGGGNGKWIVSGGTSVKKPGAGLVGATYRKLFASAGEPLETGGFADAGEWLSAVFNTHRGFDPRLQAAQQEDVPSSGGFAVPTEFAAMLLDAAIEDSIVLPRATVYPMTSESKVIPCFDGFDHSASLYGGFVGQWTTELAGLTVTAAKLRQMTLVAKKLFIMGQSSNELLADAVNGFEGQLGQAMIKATSWFLDLAMLTGSGAGRPLGVLNDPALITVAKESAQDAATIVFTNCAKMYARLHPACFKNAVWVVNSTALPQMLAMTFTSLSAVDGLRAPAVTQADDGSFRLFTRPVLVTEKLAPLGTLGDIVLADFSQYIVGLRQGASLEKSNSAGFLNDSSYFRIIERCDSQGSWKSAVTPKNGDSLSWCVTLATRA